MQQGTHSQSNTAPSVDSQDSKQGTHSQADRLLFSTQYILSSALVLMIHFISLSIDDINSFMVKAFGEPLAQCETVLAGIWYKCWLTVASLSGKYYHFPGGSIGRKYADQLTTELLYLLSGSFSSEHVHGFLVYSVTARSFC